MTKPTPTELAIADPAYWATMWKMRLGNAQFSLKDHEYQLEPLQSDAKRVCVRKATQGGWTMIYVLRVLHGLIHGKYPQGALYMFPTTDNVLDFSKSRFNPLIDANKEAIGKYITKTKGNRGTDTAALKKVGKSFLYLRGAKMSQKIGLVGDEMESTQTRSIPADMFVLDEVDLMDMIVIEKVRGRMKHSLVQEEVFLSNPTLPGHGIDTMFSASDQRYLQRKCSCGTWMCADETFPECVHVRQDGTGYIACPKCGKEVGFRTCEWVPNKSENSDYMHGYQWSQLNSVFNDPYQIVKDIEDPPLGNLADVYRLQLGLPYVAAEDKLTTNQVFALCNQDTMYSSHAGPCAMGVDVGKIKHVIIGIKTGNEQFQILKTARLSTWNDIHDLARKFNVKSAVIDIRPYEDSARAFQAAEPYRLFLCQYSENPMQDAVWNNKTNTVMVYRTGIFDKTHRLIDEAKFTIPRKGKEIIEFVTQVCGTAKVAEIHKRTGDAIYRYRPVGSAGDHYRNALNYFTLAAATGAIARVGGSARRQKVAVNEGAWV